MDYKGSGERLSSGEQKLGLRAAFLGANIFRAAQTTSHVASRELTQQGWRARDPGASTAGVESQGPSLPLCPRA